jgi:hypothetical protein
VATGLVARSGLVFTVAHDAAARREAFRLRGEAAAEWAPSAPRSDDRSASRADGPRDHKLEDERGGNERGDDASADNEVDGWDDRALHLIGWLQDRAVCAGRLVLPPGRLPTEAACLLSVLPREGVVDVGRMTVARSARGAHRGVFVALLARLYLEVRAQGYDTACGMMAPNVRGLLRLLGVTTVVLGEDRPYRGRLRAPVRFVTADAGTLLTRRWGPTVED